MTETLPPPPPGFRLVQQPQVPPPPPGFQMVDPAAPAPEPSLYDTIMADYVDPAMGVAAAGFDGIRQGFSNLAGMPVDIVNTLAGFPLRAGERAMGWEPGTLWSNNPIGGGASIDRSLRGGTVFNEPVIEDYAPQNRTERIVNRVGEEVGANLIPLGAGLRKAAEVGVEGARQMTGPIGRYVESLAVNPTRTGAKEMAYAVAAGTGAGGAREVFTDGDPNTTTSGEALADLFGSLIGAGGAAAAAGTFNALVDAKRLLLGGNASNLTRDMVAGAIGDAANAPRTASGQMDTSGLAAALARGSRIDEVVPGFKPSTGDVLANTGVQNLEYSRQSGPSQGAYATRRVENDMAVARSMDEMQPTTTPGAFRETLAQNRDAVLQEAEVAAIEARQRLDQATANLQAVQSGEARGQTLRAALDEARAAARDVERAAWANVTGDVDPAPLAAAFDSITSGLTQSETRVIADALPAANTPKSLVPDAPEGPVPSSVLDAYGRPMMKDVPPVSQMTDLSQVTTLRSELTSKIREAEAAGDPNKARILGKYVAAIDAYFDGIPRIAEPLTEARAVSRDLNDRFNRPNSPITQALAERGGAPRRPDSQVAPAFIQPDERQASVIEDVLRETGPTTQATDAREALRDQILADVSRQGMLDKPDQLRAYLDQYGQVFEKFPDLKRDLGTAAGLRENLAGAEKGWTETAKALGGADGKSGTSAVGQYLRYGDERAVDAMASVVNSKDPARAMDDLLAFAGNDPQAVEGAKSAFWQLMSKKARSTGTETRLADGAQRWRPQSLKAFIDDPANAAVMDRLYANDPDQLQRIRDLAEELSTVDMRVSQRAPATSGTPQQRSRESIVPSTETLGAYSFAYQRGQVGLPFIGLRLASTVARKALLKGRTAEFDKLLDEALLNPEVAELLLRENNPANVAALSQYAKGVLGVRSAWIDEVLGSDTPAEDDEVMGAIGEPQPRFNLPDVNLPVMNEDILRQFGWTP